MASQSYADKKELYFHLFFREVFEGANKTTETVIDPKSDFPNFGETAIMDVPLWDSLKSEKIIARAHGVSAQSDQKTLGWQLSFNIVFETPELKGSTLQVMGHALQLTGTREWSVVGGTGVFTLAQGVVYGRTLSTLDDSLWIELKIHGYYVPMMAPSWSM